MLNYWTNGGTPPTSNTAYLALLAQAERLKIENCKYQKDVIDAMFRQVNNTEIISFADNQIPGKIHAVNFDMGKNLFAYSDVDFQNTGGGSYNSGYSYRNDGVDIQVCSNPNSNGYNVGWTETGEWLKRAFSSSLVFIFLLCVDLA